MRRQSRPSGFGQNAMTKVARTIRTLIKWVAAALVVLFGYLQLKDIQIEGFVDKLNPDILRRITLFIYYSCWVAGATFDTNIMEDVHYVEPDRARLPANAIILIVAFGAVTALLLWFAGDDKGFAILLDIFFVYNIFGIVYINNYLKPISEASRNAYLHGHKYVSLIQLTIVSQYLRGAWQWHRFLAGALILIALNVVCFSTTSSRFLAEFITHRLPVLGAVTVFQLLPSVLLLVFVGVIEAWIWYKRLVTALSLSVVDRLGRSYVISPMPTRSARP